MALVKMAEEFGGLPMESLIGGPLQAACDAQTMLAGATARFIEEVGLVKEGDKQVVRTVGFSFTRSANGDDGNGPASEKVEMNIPLLAMVKVPSLSIDLVDITFDMEVKSSETQSEIDDKKGELEAEMGLQIGPFSMKAKVKGSISSHKENPRKSDNSAKYHVQVRATQGEMPEGLSRVLDILNTAINPTSIQKTAAAGAQGQEHYTADNDVA